MPGVRAEARGIEIVYQALAEAVHLRANIQGQIQLTRQTNNLIQFLTFCRGTRCVRYIPITIWDDVQYGGTLVDEQSEQLFDVLFAL